MVCRPRCSLCHLTGGPCPDQGCQSFREACFTPEPFNSRHCLSTRLWSNTWVTSHKYQPINHQFEANQNQSDNLNVLGEFQLSKGYLQKVIHISFLYEVKPFEGVLVPLNQFLLLWQLFMALFCFYKATTSWWDICALGRHPKKNRFFFFWK